MTYEYKRSVSGFGGLPTWMKASPFIYGAGPYAPGGPGGGMMLGPGKPGGPAQPAGQRLVCVQPPHGPEGVETGRSWPPAIGPQEEALMDAGCVATGRKCGGHYRSPAQYWSCPSDMMFPGSVTPHGGFYGLGTENTQRTGPLGVSWGIWLLGFTAVFGLVLIQGLGVLKDVAVHKMLGD